MTRKKKLIWIGTGLLLAGLTALFAFSGDEANEAATPTFTVAEGPLTIGITSSGSIQSKDKVTLKSELEGHNTIIWVVEEGVNVKAGDLLVEFDAATLVDKRNEPPPPKATSSSRRRSWRSPRATATQTSSNAK